MMFGPGQSLGFWLGENAMDVALVRPSRKRWKIVKTGVVDAPGVLSSPKRRADLSAAFAGCLKKMPGSARRADVSVAIAVPDEIVVEDLLSFATFPSDAREAATLVQHRMAREMGQEANAIATAHEVVGQEENAVQVRVRAMDGVLRQDIESAAAHSGLRPVRIEAWSGFASQAPDLASKPAGAAIWGDAYSWTLLCWSKDDPAGFAESGPAADAAAASADILRLVRSYARKSEVTFGPLNIDAPEPLLTQLVQDADAFGLRLERFAESGVHNNRAAQVAAWG